MTNSCFRDYDKRRNRLAESGNNDTIKLMKRQVLQKKRVFVAMSGGVDSSVAAALLKEQGYDVTGVFMQVFQSASPSLGGPDFLECTRTDDRREAMRAAAHLGIPFLSFNFEKEYKEKVVDYMISEYAAGRTPNPDVMCNKHIKFDLFLKKAREMGADYIATGHYARLGRNDECRISNFESNSNFKIKNLFKIQNSKFKIKLFKGVDTNKDQSYFLWTLTQEQLKYCLFPIGEYTKPEVREMARKFGLPNAERRDSQGVCFIGQFPMKEFLKKYIPAEKGDVLDAKGNIIGMHDGARLYTLGERHGFLVTKKTPNDPPLYVVAKDIEKNMLTVAPQNSREEVTKALLAHVNFISGEVPNTEESYDVRFRYRQPLIKATSDKRQETRVVRFEKPQRAVTPGQSLVLYKGDECVGGGVIQ
ncbi:MAG: tRNA 2-thiouridine(34) synthase MnmA [Parcubacteria group bacterium]|nr:tRNA 2-thiouridine(34) synthase MnmA [Parcubacteria group bacterium]